MNKINNKINNDQSINYIFFMYLLSLYFECSVIVLNNLYSC